MRLRFVITLVLVGLLVGAASAAAYPWPIRPFDKQHVIRANFGDPRTVFGHAILSDGLAGPGAFEFHNGVDIPAPEGTNVYPVVSGTANVINAGAVAVRTDDNRVFRYFHIIPLIVSGQRVIARHTVLGLVMHAYEHVHLTEIRGMRVWNPLAAGGIAPYRDNTAPQVDSIDVRREGSLLPLDTAHICGTVSIVAAAYDPPSLPLTRAYAGYAVSPALVTWSLRRVGGGGHWYVQDDTVADFRTTLPLPRYFWDVYARGSFQNSPRFSRQQFHMPGRYYYNLASRLHTESYPNSVYEVTVDVADMRGNWGEAQQRFTIANKPGSPTGCQEPSSAP
jgi:hypothetical protein